MEARNSDPKAVTLRGNQRRQRSWTVLVIPPSPGSSDHPGREVDHRRRFRLPRSPPVADPVLDRAHARRSIARRGKKATRRDEEKVYENPGRLPGQGWFITPSWRPVFWRATRFFARARCSRGHGVTIEFLPLFRRRGRGSGRVSTAARGAKSVERGRGMARTKAMVARLGESSGSSRRRPSS